ncbi:hypothetical protein DFJ58DRAFT_736482 [Suillus subalutaceus]|uniref:uncharacterized protein n=1 Tax=Suillus subalutaceus TaxID=48586 RepID=UPI001B863077|nr:uncharacterized protein DFJ58DRAFT_736482 [Suillus subalutaceus]KAG1831960.1 hypothetical protein DFJ58DRAFT_736482 [Suillus subalutaceus]
MQNVAESLTAVLGSAGSYWLSPKSQNNDLLTLQLRPNTASPTSKFFLPSPRFSPVPPANAEAGWEGRALTGDSLKPTYPDDAGVGGSGATVGDGVSMLGEEHNASLHHILDPASIISPTPSGLPVAREVLCAPATPASTPTLGPDPLFSPQSAASFDGAGSDHEPSAQVLTAINVLQSPFLQVPSPFSVLPAPSLSAQALLTNDVLPTPSPSPQVLRANHVLPTPSPPAQVLTANSVSLTSPSAQGLMGNNVFATSPSPQLLAATNVLAGSPIIYSTPTTHDSASHSIPCPNPVAISSLPTPLPSAEDWRSISPSPSMPLDTVLPQPYVESFVRSSAGSPSDELWVDARRVIHVTSVSNGPYYLPSIERVRFLESPTTVPSCKSPESTVHDPDSPPPPYAPSHVDEFVRMTTVLPVLDGHQYLLDYFASDLPAICDEHPRVLDDVADEYVSYFKRSVENVTEPFPSPGPRSERDWDDRARDLLDHRAHSRALIAKLEDSLSPRMLHEGLRRPSVLACDPNQRIVAEFHGEHVLASSIKAALLLPYPDPNIVHSLVEEHVLDEQDEFKVIKYARARDRALEIRRLRICACFDDDSDSNDDEQGPSESHIFFLP